MSQRAARDATQEPGLQIHFHFFPVGHDPEQVGIRGLILLQDNTNHVCSAECPQQFPHDCPACRHCLTSVYKEHLKHFEILQMDISVYPK